MGITGLATVCRNLPVSIIAFELVLAHQCRATAEVGIIEIELQIVLIVSKSIAVQMSHFISNGKHLAIILRHFYTINRQHLAGMNAGLSVQEVSLHRLRRHELAAVRTAQHHIARRRNTGRVAEILPVVLILAGRQEAVHLKLLSLKGYEESITYGGYPNLSFRIFNQSLNMGIIQDIDTAHVRFFLIH